MSNKIINLVQNNEKPLHGKEARAKVASFLRERADIIENEETDDAERCALIVYSTFKDSSLFRLYSLYCNVSNVIEKAGLLSMAHADLCDTRE